MNLSTVKWAQWHKTQSRELLGLFICVCIALCTTVAHNIAQNRSDNFPSYPPNNHHCSDDVCLREGWAELARASRLSRCQDAINDFEAKRVGGIQAKRQARKTTTIWTTGQRACASCVGACESRIGLYAQWKYNQWRDLSTTPRFWPHFRIATASWY